MCVVAGGAAIGVLATVLAGRKPGVMLGAFLIAATVAAALAVRARVAYVIIPAPALAYALAATAAGLIQDPAAGASRAMFAVSAVQWFAGGFISVTAATLIAIAIAAARWMRGPSGTVRRAERRGPARTAGSGGGPSAHNRADSGMPEAGVSRDAGGAGRRRDQRRP